VSLAETRRHQLYPVLDAAQVETARRFASEPARDFTQVTSSSKQASVTCRRGSCSRAQLMWWVAMVPVHALGSIEARPPSSAACIITAFAFDFPTGTAELLHERVASDPSNAVVRLVRRTSTTVKSRRRVALSVRPRSRTRIK
jgi:hypothetical protein